MEPLLKRLSFNVELVITALLGNIAKLAILLRVLLGSDQVLTCLAFININCVNITVYDIDPCALLNTSR